jgi:ribosomal protein S18 acetylase RimI-like enzyme
MLRDLSLKTFGETFSNLNTESNMEAYFREAFSFERLSEELSCGGSQFYFLYAEERLAGYLKLNEAPNQTDINDESSLEIERIYVSKEYQGKGLGRALMQKAVEISVECGKAYMWLGVWEKNEKAISFYKKNGFYVYGTHHFIMGGEEQRDYIMRKDLTV